jgi:hypothetical protein
LRRAETVGVCARSIVGRQGIEAVPELAANLWPSASAASAANVHQRSALQRTHAAALQTAQRPHSAGTGCLRPRLDDRLGVAKSAQYHPEHCSIFVFYVKNCLKID